MKIELEKLIWGKLRNKESKENKGNLVKILNVLKRIGRMYQI